MELRPAWIAAAGNGPGEPSAEPEQVANGHAVADSALLALDYEIEQQKHELMRLARSGATIGQRLALERNIETLHEVREFAGEAIELTGTLTTEAQRKVIGVLLMNQVLTIGLNGMIPNSSIQEVQDISRVGVETMRSMHAAAVRGLHTRVVEFDPQPPPVTIVDKVVARLKGERNNGPIYEAEFRR